VLKYFSKFLNDKRFQKFYVEDWCAKNFYSGFGSFPELSTIDEAVLVLENLTPKGYRSGPKLNLDEPHLMLMVKTIARYHSLTYALRVVKDPMLDQLIAGIKPLRFVEPNGANNLYTAVYKIAMDRLFDFLDKSPEYLTDPKFAKDLEKFRTKYGSAPLELMETFRSDEQPFSVILHGDYNRNNVLFKYEQPDGFENPIDMKMIDFQEIRYGSPALDLSFFMFMNIHQDLRPKVWEKLLKCYHETMFQSLVSVVGCDANDERLFPYRFGK
jgi:Ecdysteroid kinase-like family